LSAKRIVIAGVFTPATLAVITHVGFLHLTRKATGVPTSTCGHGRLLCCQARLISMRLEVT